MLQNVNKIIISAKSFITRQYMKNVLNSEKEFKIEEGPGRIKYLLQPNEKSDKLLVVFSGFPLIGKPPVYNYVLTFRNLKCNKLFILDDFGEDYRGTYYLGTNEKWFLTTEITNLISTIKTQLNIKDENITLTGSSKGGFAALYYAFKDTYGCVIAAEPQIMVGNYLSAAQHLGVFNNIMGEYTKEKREALNKVIFNITEQRDQYPNKVIIFCGKNNDYYLKKHLIYFTSYLEKKGISHELVLGDFSQHSQVGKHYPKLVYNYYND
ncbi:prolyl oligopeptidase family serine peptidase [Oceanobacillus profundus]|uniref:accessory Sec system protein Asp2 n=1 Tax=Oceanobacillus profundus TaxID=372463 RepID=UPI00203F2CD7|nr:accessory Sec system protein Asp2 [Oceanobacillus profundus]MCM3399451.1 prolyl oligopeptidase family serine peptidase [Oceanobacillus profundus]